MSEIFEQMLKNFETSDWISITALLLSIASVGYSFWKTKVSYFLLPDTASLFKFFFDDENVILNHPNYFNYFACGFTVFNNSQTPLNIFDILIKQNGEIALHTHKVSSSSETFVRVYYCEDQAYSRIANDFFNKHIITVKPFESIPLAFARTISKPVNSTDNFRCEIHFKVIKTTLLSKLRFLFNREEKFIGKIKSILNFTNSTPVYVKHVLRVDLEE